MTTYTLTTGGPDGLTDEMLRGLVVDQAHEGYSTRLRLIVRQLEAQLPRPLKIGDPCHLINGVHTWTAEMTVLAFHEDKVWVLDEDGDRPTYWRSQVAFGPRPS